MTKINTINLQELKNNRPHFPVLLREVLNSLKLPSDDEPKEKIYLDCTFGFGGYSEFILSTTSTKVIAIDRDESVLPRVKSLQEKYPNRLLFALNTFSNYPKVLADFNIEKVDGIIMDLGFSTMQLNDKNRGFSFKENGDLSMAMGLNKINAKEFVNSATEQLLADVIFHYGEEHKAKQIAKNIVKHRTLQPINTTLELSTIVKEVTGFGNYKGKNHKKSDTSTKTFQAIRIYVNDELKELETALKNSCSHLNQGGVLSIVSFHSLEDRMVKQFMNDFGENIKYDKFTFYKLKDNTIDSKKIDFNILTKKPIVPTEEELEINSPSSSAKLRVAEKL